MGRQTSEMAQVQISTSKMSLKLCLPLAVVALLATAIPLVSANTSAEFVLGNEGTVCPDSDLVGTAAECTRASAALNLGGFCGNVDWSNAQIGCVFGDGMVNFNSHATGAVAARTAPICVAPIIPSNEPTSMPSNEPTAYVQGPISTTCLELKSSYQKNSCCSQDMGKVATFNGTAVTCGNVLASYKSSECCSADLAKNATMNYE